MIDFQNGFTDTLGNKSTLQRLSKIPPNIKRVATLPCEILLSTVEYLQGSVASLCGVVGSLIITAKLLSK